MNKLYVINFTLPNGYVISTYSVWRKELIVEKMEKNPEWKYELVENNPIHAIWKAV